MYYFKKKIKCLKCNGHFRGVTERGKRKYYCSTYHNYRTCIRWKVEESWLIELIHNHFIIDQYKEMKIVGGKGETNPTTSVLTETLIERVHEITVNPVEQEITIYFKDGTKTFMSNTRQAYWTDDSI